MILGGKFSRIFFQVSNSISLLFQSREDPSGETVEVRRPNDPRRSSVSLDVFKSFRDPHDKRNMPAKDKTIYVEGPSKYVLKYPQINGTEKNKKITDCTNFFNER